MSVSNFKRISSKSERNSSKRKDTCGRVDSNPVKFDKPISSNYFSAGSHETSFVMEMRFCPFAKGEHATFVSFPLVLDELFGSRPTFLRPSTQLFGIYKQPKKTNEKEEDEEEEEKGGEEKEEEEQDEE